jgi:hypothetical protein
MAGSDPLPSWNEGSTKQSILDFVRGVTTAGAPHFVKPEERIAVFDNDGTRAAIRPTRYCVQWDRNAVEAKIPTDYAIGFSSNSRATRAESR